MARDPVSVFHKITSAFAIAVGVVTLASQAVQAIPAPQPGQSWIAWAMVGVPSLLGLFAHVSDAKR